MFRRILAILRPDRKACLVVIAITIVMGFAAAVLPLLRKEVIDLITGGGPGAWVGLIVVLATMVGLETVKEATQCWASFLSNRVRRRTALRLFSGILEGIFQRDLARHQDQKSGELLNRIHRGVYGFTEGVFDATLNLLPAIVFVVAAAGFMVWLDWKLTLVVLGFAWIPAWISFKTGSALRDKERAVSERWEKAYGRLSEGLSLFKIVKAFCMEQHERRRCLDELKEVQELDLSASRYDNVSASAKRLISFLTQVVILGYGGYLVMNGEMTYGTVAAFSGFADALFAPMLGLAGTYEHLQKARVHLENVLEFLETQPQLQDAPDAAIPDRLAGHLVFEDVTFGYGDNGPVLKGVNLEIKPGQTVALVGLSGSGKTTLADLACRFRDPGSGRVTIDGVDLRQVPQRWWRQQVGLVLQDNRLFAGTIRENIVYGKPDATDDEVAAAAAAAHAAEFINARPQGYDTELGEGGAGLSGGEMQRLAIARALIKRPLIVVLDEATSNLDIMAELAVKAAMEELRKERTVLVIAHRLSTVRNADVICFLENGEIVEQGTYDELMARQGSFSSLVKAGELK
jgi:ATP-binding cassette subfamily B protein